MTGAGTSRRGLLLALVPGWAMVAYGVAGALDAFDHYLALDPIRFGVWLVASGAVVDVLVTPAVCLCGVLAGRLLPAWCRPPVQIAAIVSLPLVALAVPLVRGWGLVSTNPSIQPLNYAHGTLLALGAVWAAAMTVALARYARERLPA